MANVNKLQDANGNEYNLQDTISGYQNSTQVNSAISTHNSSNSAHSDIRTEVSGKQATLVSGTNIKTINNNSLLGSGNISISGGTWGQITGTLSNQTDLNTALSNKVDTSSLAQVNPMITSYVSGTSGYNIWANGYCEQWGITTPSSSNKKTVSLLKTFANTSYNVVFGNQYTTTSTAVSNVETSTKKVSSFVIIDGTNTAYYTYWRACGYLAEGQY